MRSSDFDDMLNEVIDFAGNERIEENPAETEKTCPECSRNFVSLKIKGSEVDFCRYCKSYWFDSGELAQVTGRTTDIPDTTLRSRESEYPCPVCGEIMKEHIFLRGDNLLVDRCPDHGVYLESGELQRAIDTLKE